MLQEEANLLYVLVDAADDAGRLNGENAARWREAKHRFCHHDQSAGALLYLLLDSLDYSGAIRHTWIQARWSTVKARISAGAGVLR